MYKLIIGLSIVILSTTTCKKKYDNLLITYETEIIFYSEKDFNGIDTSYLEIVAPLSKARKNCENI